jgi:hypothetical protein
MESVSPFYGVMRCRSACNWQDRFRLPLDEDIQGFQSRTHGPYPAGLFSVRPQSGRLRRYLTVPMHSLVSFTFFVTWWSGNLWLS